MRKILLVGILILSGCVTIADQSLNTAPYQPSAQEIANSAAMDQARKSCGEAKVGMSEKEKEKIYSCIKTNYKNRGGTVVATNPNGSIGGTATATNFRPAEPECGFMQEFFGGRDCRKEKIQRAMSACASRKTWIDKMQCKQMVPISDPLDAEINAYISVLIEQVKTYQMTEAQAEYAFQRKVSEVTQHIDQVNVEQQRLNLIEGHQDALANQQKMERMNETIQQNNDRMMEVLKNNQQNTSTPMPRIRNLERMECQPDGYGGMRCTTYH